MGAIYCLVFPVMTLLLPLVMDGVNVYVSDIGAICCLVFPVMSVLLPLVMDGEQFRCLV